MRNPSRPQLNGDQLRNAAKLYVELEGARNNEEKFIICMEHATKMYDSKQLGFACNDLLLNVIMRMIKTHLSDGINPNSVIIKGRPAIFKAVGFPALLKLLLTHGTNFNATDTNLNTPLHWICILASTISNTTPYLTCAEMLVAYGANPAPQNIYNKTPVEDIRQFNHLPYIHENHAEEFKTNFIRATQSPRNIDDIPFEIIEEASSETIPLTDHDLENITRYRNRMLRSRHAIRHRVIQVDVNRHTDRGIDYRQEITIFQRIPQGQRTTTIDYGLSNFPSPAQARARAPIQHRMTMESKKFNAAPKFTLDAALNDHLAKVTELPTLNAVQKSIVEATLNYIFDDISSSMPASQVIRLLSSFNSSSTRPLTYFTTKKWLIELDVWDSVKQLRNLFLHPAPQNRYVGDDNAFRHKYLKGRDPITPEEMTACQTGVHLKTVYYFKSGFGSEVLTEPQGMLGLSARNDNTAPPATRMAVKHVINSLIEREILKHKNQAASKIQFWYKRTRDENKALSMIENREESLLANKIRQRRG